MIPNPSGLCKCGCGRVTPLATQSRSDTGAVRGEHLRYVHGHNGTPSPLRFVVSAEGCWLWTLGVDKYGYGTLTDRGTRRKLLAHRVYYERVNGPIPEGLQIDHLCRNRACVNPAHLEAVTCAENVRRGRLASLNEADVIAIRARLARGDYQADIAAAFGVSKGAISQIRCGKTWRGVGVNA